MIKQKELIPVALIEDTDGLPSYELGKNMKIKNHSFELGHIIDGWSFKPLHNFPINIPVDPKTLKETIEIMGFEKSPNAYLQLGFPTRYSSNKKHRQIYFLRLERLSTDVDARRFIGDIPSEEKFSTWFKKD